MHFFPSESPVPPSVLPKTSQVMMPKEGTEEALTEAVSPQDAQQFAKRIVRVPDTRKEASSDPGESQSLTLAESRVIRAETLFKKALQGDILSATDYKELTATWLTKFS